MPSRHAGIALLEAVSHHLSALPITAIRTAIAFRILALLDPINIVMVYYTVAIPRPCTVPLAVRDFEITLLLPHTASHSRTSYSE